MKLEAVEEELQKASEISKELRVKGFDFIDKSDGYKIIGTVYTEQDLRSIQGRKFL